MERLIIKNILDNTNKIDLLNNYIKKRNILTGIGLLSMGIVLISQLTIIKEHEEKILDLQIEIEEMKSKGE